MLCCEAQAVKKEEEKEEDTISLQNINIINIGHTCPPRGDRLHENNFSWCFLRNKLLILYQYFGCLLFVICSRSKIYFYGE